MLFQVKSLFYVWQLETYFRTVSLNPLYGLNLFVMHPVSSIHRLCSMIADCKTIYDIMKHGPKINIFDTLQVKISNSVIKRPIFIFFCSINLTSI